MYDEKSPFNHCNNGLKEKVGQAKTVKQLAEELALPYSTIYNNPRSEEDFWKVVNVANKQQRRILLCCLYTAGRMMEVFRLQPADVDWHNSRIRLWTRKRRGGGWEYDWIPMVEELSQIIQEQKKECPFQEYLFEPDGESVEHWARYMMPNLCKEAKVTPFGFHAIRHLSASIMDKAGVSIKTIQLILRHKNISTTSNYLHSLRGVKTDLGQAFSQKKILQSKSGSED